MIWVRLQSKWANLTLAVLGVVYTIVGIALVVMLTLDTWGAAGMIDRLLQVVLAGVVVVGAWFVANAMRNLNRPLHLPSFRHPAEPRARVS